jgi:hypothetical protein
VLTLTGGDTSRVLLTSDSGVSAIDVAANVVNSGETRRGDPPDVGPLAMLVLACLAGGVLLIVRVVRVPRRELAPVRGRTW